MEKQGPQLLELLRYQHIQQLYRTHTKWKGAEDREIKISLTSRSLENVYKKQLQLLKRGEQVQLLPFTKHLVKDKIYQD